MKNKLHTTMCNADDSGLPGIRQPIHKYEFQEKKGNVMRVSELSMYSLCIFETQ